jgi:hypothetical protein
MDVQARWMVLRQPPHSRMARSLVFIRYVMGSVIYRIRPAQWSACSAETTRNHFAQPSSSPFSLLSRAISFAISRVSPVVISPITVNVSVHRDAFPKWSSHAAFQAERYLTLQNFHATHIRDPTKSAPGT